MSAELNGWYWTKDCDNDPWRLTRFKRGLDRQGDTRKWYATIGPQVPTPAEMQATELELAKRQNRVDDLDKTLAETREERDRLRAEVERLQPKEKGGWRFFDARDGDFWAVTGNDRGVMFGIDTQAWYPSSATLEACLRDQDPELTIHEAYARLADWPEGQRKFRELTGYEQPPYTADAVQQFVDMWGPKIGSKPEHLARHVPPTCKESLPVQTEELVRCYRSKYGSSVLVYGVQHNTHFSPHGDWGPAQLESSTIKHKIRCTISEARAMLAGLPKSLAEFDRITTGRDEDRDHLARLLAIPCKEMRV
jgi:hypothetical protein